MALSTKNGGATDSHSGDANSARVQHQHWRVYGQVQGVGFRPFVFNLAQHFHLVGGVFNDGAGVQINLQGKVGNLQHFHQHFLNELPAAARVERVERVILDELLDKTRFEILQSQPGSVHTTVTPDLALCQNCLNELFDSSDRRYLYPFINCTACGPRYTIVENLPYDRPSTTMASFSLCPACQSEYNNPKDRRFHAQPNACEQCGPQLTLLDHEGNIVSELDPTAGLVKRLKAGDVVAIKSLGGFHLACDARNVDAVNRLRERKSRAQKPFALMVANLVSAADFVELGQKTEECLLSSAAPIVLLKKKKLADKQLQNIAPELSEIGIMLPSAPLHWLLFYEAAGRPKNKTWLAEKQALVLVMTSANPQGEALVYQNDTAVERLAGIADSFLVHNREIETRCDDAIVQADGHVIRFARGFAPGVIRMAQGGPAVLACGGWYKNSVTLTDQNRALLSHYIGDLDKVENCRAMEKTVAHFLRLFESQPAAVACDLHPDFYSTRFAEQFAHSRQLPLIKVQHHQAHIAAVMAEHQLDGPVLGLALDGTGMGDNGKIWGGELLKVDTEGFQRLGYLKELALPGGDRASLEPWRIAVSFLYLSGNEARAELLYGKRVEYQTVIQMIKQQLNCPMSSSAGRWFDIAASLLGVCDKVSYEAEAAIKLEALASSYGRVEADKKAYCIEANRLDVSPLIERLIECTNPAWGAALFHATFSQALADWLTENSRQHGCDDIVLAGGCFSNRLLRDSLTAQLKTRHLNVWNAKQVPCNDSGLSLGQAWVALNKINNE